MTVHMSVVLTANTTAPAAKKVGNQVEGRGGAKTQDLVLAGGDQDGRPEAEADDHLGRVEKDFHGRLAGDNIADQDDAGGDR